MLNRSEDDSKNIFQLIFIVDVWSVGCIMGEMIRGTVLFPGDDRMYIHCFTKNFILINFSTIT